MDAPFGVVDEGHSGSYSIIWGPFGFFNRVSWGVRVIQGPKKKKGPFPGSPRLKIKSKRICLRSTTIETKIL